MKHVVVKNLCCCVRRCFCTVILQFMNIDFSEVFVVLYNELI